jgi:hypothetical protein
VSAKVQGHKIATVSCFYMGFWVIDHRPNKAWNDQTPWRLTWSASVRFMIGVHAVLHLRSRDVCDGVSHCTCHARLALWAVKSVWKDWKTGDLFWLCSPRELVLTLSHDFVFSFTTPRCPIPRNLIQFEKEWYVCCKTKLKKNALSYL